MEEVHKPHDRMTTHGDLPPDIISNSTSSRRTDDIGLNAINGVNEINGSNRLTPSVQGVETPSVKVEPADPQSAGDIDVKPSSSVLDSVGPNAEWEAQLGGKKRKWAALGFNPSQMDELEGVALRYVGLGFAHVGLGWGFGTAVVDSGKISTPKYPGHTT